jgi:hypothetical protein
LPQIDCCGSTKTYQLNFKPHKVTKSRCALGFALSRRHMTQQKRNLSVELHGEQFPHKKKLFAHFTWLLGRAAGHYEK